MMTITKNNRFNIHKLKAHSLKKYFGITNKRIALLGMLLAVNIICEIISQYVLGAAKISGFLSFSITLWTVMVVFLTINSFYTFVFLEITEFFRMAFGQDIISTISLNLSDLTFLVIFAFIAYVLNWIVGLFKEKKKERLSYFIVLCVAMIIAILAGSGMDVVYNKYFIISWYYGTTGSSIDVESWLLILIFWFNIVEFVINCAIFIAIYNVTFLLAKRFNQ